MTYYIFSLLNLSIASQAVQNDEMKYYENVSKLEKMIYSITSNVVITHMRI